MGRGTTSIKPPPQRKEENVVLHGKVYSREKKLYKTKGRVSSEAAGNVGVSGRSEAKRT